MRTISKGPEPSDLTAWKHKNPRKSYDELDPIIRRIIRQCALIDDLSQPQQNQIDPFMPVVINILRSWLQS